MPFLGNRKKKAAAASASTPQVARPQPPAAAARPIGLPPQSQAIEPPRREIELSIARLRGEYLKPLAEVLENAPSPDMVDWVDILVGEAHSSVAQLDAQREACVHDEDLAEQIVMASSEFSALEDRAQQWKHSALHGSDGAHDEAALRRQQEDDIRRQQEEQLRKQQEEAIRKQQEDEEEQLRQVELRKRQEQEEMRRLQQEADMRRQHEEHQQKQQEEAIRKQQEDMRRQQEQLIRLQQEERERKHRELELQNQNEEAAKRMEEDRRAREHREQEALRYQQEQDNQRKRDLEARQRADEEQRHQRAEAERQRKRHEEEERSRRLEEAQRQKAQWAAEQAEQQKEAERKRRERFKSFQSDGQEHADAYAAMMEESQRQRDMQYQLAKVERRNEAQRQLQVALEKAYTDDPGVLQTALSQARGAGVGDVAPDLIHDSEQILLEVQRRKQQREAAQQLQNALDSTPHETEQLRQAVANARAVGFSGLQLEAAVGALQRCEEVDRRQREAQAAKDLKLRELVLAMQGRDAEHLSRCISQAQQFGIADTIISRARAHLTALSFLSRLRGLGVEEVVMAWLEASKRMRQAHQALKTTMDSGCDADVLAEAVQAAEAADLYEEDLDKAKKLVVHRRTARDQAVVALSTKKMEDLKLAKATNLAAGGPIVDMPEIQRSIDQVDAENKMLQSLDAGLPAAIDDFFKEKAEAKKREEEEMKRQEQARKREEQERRIRETEARAERARQQKQLEREEARAAFGAHTTSMSHSRDVMLNATQPPSLSSTSLHSTKEAHTEEQHWWNTYAAMKPQVEEVRQWISQHETNHQRAVVQNKMPMHPYGPPPAQNWMSPHHMHGPIMAIPPGHPTAIAAPYGPGPCPCGPMPCSCCPAPCFHRPGPQVRPPMPLPSEGELKNESMLQGPNSYRTMMMSAAQLAESLPRRSYEDPNFWR